jgi:hypothetical protein
MNAQERSPKLIVYEFEACFRKSDLKYIKGGYLDGRKSNKITFKKDRVEVNKI